MQVQISVNKPVFFPGDMVIGIVHIETPKPQKIRSIAVGAEGYEMTRITESHGMGKHRHTHTYVSKNTMQAFSKVLAGEGEIPPGSYDYPFEYQIPPNVLPTYHGYHANVAYVIGVNADIPMWFDSGQTVELPVRNPRRELVLDATPVRFQSDYYLDPSKPGFVVDLERTMFTTGDVIQGWMTLTGTGGKEVRKADILLQTMEYAVAQGHSRDVPATIMQGYVQGQALVAGGKASFALPIPRGAPGAYNGVYSRLRYMLVVNLDISWGFDVSAGVEVVVINNE